MNIRTIKDAHPENIYVMPRRYKAIKHAKPWKSFEVDDYEIEEKF